MLVIVTDVANFVIYLKAREQSIRSCLMYMCSRHYHNY